MPEAAPTDFIQTWDQALDAASCRTLIERFEASGQAERGRIGGGVDTALKDSWDICIDRFENWQDVVAQLNEVMARCLLDYLRAHPFLLLAPLSLRVPDSAGGTRMLTPDDLTAMDDARLMGMLRRLLRPGTINLQKYLADEGGYPYWHCESYPKLGDSTPLHRILLWSIYLNDGFADGETEFFHQQRKITPRTGCLLMAPAGFTHTHRGNRPRGGDKYIATSWVLFQDATHIYG